MAIICYHASHEQFPPSQLLDLVIAAEKAGFGGIHSSDHFHPWSKRQGQSGFSFSWIGAAMQATSLPYSLICAPGQRYHPAIIAQAFATLCEMFEGRINFELGSGEAINERITGEGWPDKNIRNERLLESVDIIRKLLKGEEVSHVGHVKVQEARIYTLPQNLPLLLCAAVSKETAEWAGTWADGLLTVADGDLNHLKEKIEAFKKNGGEGKQIYVQYGFSYARSENEATGGAFDQWRSNIMDPDKLANLSRVSDFEREGDKNTIEDVLEAMPVHTRISEIDKKIQELEELGVDRIILHNIHFEQLQFIQDFSNSNKSIKKSIT